MNFHLELLKSSLDDTIFKWSTYRFSDLLNCVVVILVIEFVHFLFRLLFPYGVVVVMTAVEVLIVMWTFTMKRNGVIFCRKYTFAISRAVSVFVNGITELTSRLLWLSCLLLNCLLRIQHTYIWGLDLPLCCRLPLTRTYFNDLVQCEVRFHKENFHDRLTGLPSTMRSRISGFLNAVAICYFGNLPHMTPCRSIRIRESIVRRQ